MGELGYKPTYRGYFTPFKTVSGAHLVDLGNDQTAHNACQFSVKQPDGWIILMIPMSVRNTE